MTPDLRKERKRRGLSVDQVAQRTRIPRRYIEALEMEDDVVLPPGPFRQGYLRQYMEELGMTVKVSTLDADDYDPDDHPAAGLRPDESADTIAVETEGPDLGDSTSEPAPEPSTTIPRGEELPVVRLVVTGFVLTLAVVIGLRLGSQFVDPAAAEPVAPVLTPQTARVRAIEPTRVTVLADGVVRHEGVLGAGETVDATAGERLELRIDDLSTVVVTHDGERIEPLHNLSAPRRLVFLQEAGG